MQREDSEASKRHRAWTALVGTSSRADARAASGNIGESSLYGDALSLLTVMRPTSTAMRRPSWVPQATKGDASFCNVQCLDGC